jgi:hypothetical protein
MLRIEDLDGAIACLGAAGLKVLSAQELYAL